MAFATITVALIFAGLTYIVLRWLVGKDAPSYSPSLPDLSVFTASGSADTSSTGTPIRKTVSIETVAKAIQKYEGWYPGSHSFRNNNPGNLRSGNRATGTDNAGYAIYPTVEDGWADLLALLAKRVRQHPSWTLLDLFSSYAPAADGNDPAMYAGFVGRLTGLDPLSKIGDLS